MWRIRPSLLHSVSLPASVALAMSACSIDIVIFSPIEAGMDAPVTDAPTMDAPAVDAAPPPVSCKAIHDAAPALPSGTYAIDPDGSGGDPPVSVACDMLTDGGGWTIVFFPPTTNLETLPISYTAGTPRLMADAESALVAYRNVTGVSLPDYVRFTLPDAWRTTPPFNADAVDLTISININGGAPISTMLRYGQASFSMRCEHDWAPSSWSRVCFKETQAPFFSGFSHSSNDYCTTSLSLFDATACTDDRRFSIAVR
jgi:hypothetical protein